MNVLQINIIFIYLLSFFYNLKSKISSKFFLLFSTIFFIILNGLRHIHVGTDTFRYYNRFIQMLNTNNFKEFLKIDMEIGYKIAQKIFQLFSNNFNLWLLIIAIFIYTIFAVVISKYSKNYFLSYLLFITLGYFDFSFTGIRQTIAILIVFNSYRYLINRKAIKFIVNCLIASSFHKSALIFLPVYFISNIKWNKIHIIYSFLILLMVYFFRLQIGKALTLIYYDEIAELMLSKYTSSIQVTTMAVMLFLILIWGVFIYNPMKYNNRENVVFTNILFMSVIIQLISSFSYLFTRLNMYFIIFLVLYIPNVLYNIDKLPINMNPIGYKISKLIFTLIFMIVLTTRYVYSIGLNESNILPYYFYWK